MLKNNALSRNMPSFSINLTLNHSVLQVLLVQQTNIYVVNRRTNDTKAPSVKILTVFDSGNTKACHLKMGSDSFTQNIRFSKRYTEHVYQVVSLINICSNRQTVTDSIYFCTVIPRACNMFSNLLPFCCVHGIRMWS